MNKNLKEALSPFEYTFEGNDLVITKCLDLSSPVISVPEGVTVIGDGAFSLEHTDGYLEDGDIATCPAAWEEIRLPSTLVTIGEEAFYGCKRLKKIHLPHGLKHIGDMAFSSCLSLKSLTLPATIETFSAGFCDELETVVLSEGLKKLPIGVFFFSKLKEIVIPPSVELISASAFYCSPVKNLLLHEGLREIGTNAFFHCEAEEVVIPSTVERIGAGAFAFSGMTLYLPSENVVFFDLEGHESRPARENRNDPEWRKKYCPVGEIVIGKPVIFEK